ncbi:MAG: CoA transferase [Chloroflexi bacterium]|nr:CoA transferase [Chloroflexota bacterium]
MAELALADIKVIDLTQRIAGPYCTKLLADYGADVIKVERPGTGDLARSLGPFFHDDPHPEKSGLFLALNTNKRGITLDLKSAAGRKILLELVRDADLLIESYAPGAMESFGLGYHVLERANPKLTMVSISNFGQTGPYRDFKATEIVLYGLGGEMYSCGNPQREPAKLYGDIGQFHAGLNTAGLALGAVFGARASGQGQWVDVSLMELWAASQDRRTTLLIGYQYTGEEYPRLPTSGLGLASGYYPCADGYFAAGALLHWDAFVNWLDSPEHPHPVLRDPKWRAPTAQGNPQLREELDAMYYPFLADKTMVELWESAQAAKLPSSPLYGVADLFKDPHFAARGYFVEIDHPATGPLKYPGAPYRLEKSPWAIRRPAPLLGQHNAKVLGALGYSKEDLVLLREQGVI